MVGFPPLFASGSILQGLNIILDVLGLAGLVGGRPRLVVCLGSLLFTRHAQLFLAGRTTHDGAWDRFFHPQQFQTMRAANTHGRGAPSPTLSPPPRTAPSATDGGVCISEPSMAADSLFAT